MRNRKMLSQRVSAQEHEDDHPRARSGRPRKLANSSLILQGEVYAWPGDAPLTASGRRRQQIPYLLISGPGLHALGFEVGRRYRMKPDGPDRLVLQVVR